MAPGPSKENATASSCTHQPHASPREKRPDGLDEALEKIPYSLEKEENHMSDSGPTHRKAHESKPKILHSLEKEENHMSDSVGTHRKAHESNPKILHSLEKA